MSAEPVNEQEEVRQPEPTNILAVIAQAAVDPRCDPDKLERLFALQERYLQQQRQAAFADALARLQAKIPQIGEHGQIVVDGRTRSTFTPYEDLDSVVRKLMAEEGFSFTVDEKVVPSGEREYTGKLLHREGHAETKTFTVKLDTSGSKNATQATGSTFSYARRYLLTTFLNLVTRNADNDGQGDPDPISEEQVLNLQALMQEVKADSVRFLTFMKVPALHAILARDYVKAVAALEAKRRKGE